MDLIGPCLFVHGGRENVQDSKYEHRISYVRILLLDLSL